MAYTMVREETLKDYSSHSTNDELNASSESEPGEFAGFDSSESYDGL